MVSGRLNAARPRLKTWYAFLCAMLLVLEFSIAAAADSASFSIDAQLLPSAVKAYVEQSGIQLLYPYELVQGVAGNRVYGRLDKREALRIMLRGTGLDAIFIADNAAAIRPTGASDDKNNSAASNKENVDVSAHEATAATGDGNAGKHGALPLRSLEEIVVTARRREESLSKTPVTVAAFTGQELQWAGINNVIQLQYAVPALMVSREKQGVVLSIRGATTTDTTTKGEPGISFNTDGIPVNRSEEQALNMFDVQRVEVLNGPQGTLYGKSSTGGAINVYTNAPSPVNEASVAVELGNFNTKRLDAMINMPLSDVLAVRVAVNANYRDGYIKLIGANGNDNPNSDNNVSGRISALARFNDRLSVRVTATVGRIYGSAYGLEGAVLNVGDDYRGEGTTLGYANRFEGRVRDRFAKGNVQMDASTGPLSITYLGAYSQYDTDNFMPNYRMGVDGTRLWVRDTYNTVYHELRLANNDATKLQYIAGINFFNEKIDENGHLWTIDPAPVQYPGYDPDYSNAINLLNRTAHTTHSAYVHTNYKLTAQWRIVAGLRESSDQTTRQGTLAFGPFAALGPNGPIPWLNRSGTACTGLDDCIGTPNDGSGKSAKLTYNIGTDYQFTPTQMGYFTIATGYKAGGFNDVSPVTNKPEEYGPESMTAYEVGYKLRQASALQFSSSLYYYDYSKDQISQLVQLNNDPTHFTLYTRLVPVEVHGWENMLVYPFTRNDVVNLSANFVAGHYKKLFAGPMYNIDFSGKSLDRVPAVALSASFNHDWILRNGSMLRLRAASRYMSSYYVTDLSEARQYQQKPFTRSDLDITFSSANGKRTTQFFVRNIENKVQITGAAQSYVPGTPGSASGAVSEPRFWGVRQEIRF